MFGRLRRLFVRCNRVIDDLPENAGKTCFFQNRLIVFGSANMYAPIYMSIHIYIYIHIYILHISELRGEEGVYSG